MNSSTLYTVRRQLKKAAIQTGLEAVSAATSFGLMPKARGLGAIFTLHRVEPQQQLSFDPNAHLSITPKFLEQSILALKAKGYKAIALSDLPKHLMDPNPVQPVAVFTLDDGYRNNFEYALPVFKKHDIPFTVFACSGFVTRTHSMWWETVAQLVHKADHLNYDLGLGPRTLKAARPSEKYNLFCWLAHDMMSSQQSESIEILNQLASEHGINAADIADQLIMNERELKQLSNEPLAGIGAHTISHANLSRLSEDMLKSELTQSQDDICSIVGEKPSTFAFPYGKQKNANTREFQITKDLGFDLSVTTEPNVLNDNSRDNLHCLNRISLNGYYQKARYTNSLASGIPFKFLNT